MRHVEFERITPDQVRVGDLVMCFQHDDQLERRAARVVACKLDNTPGVLERSGTGWHFAYPYAYRAWLTCRHISLKRLDAEGGPEYIWHRFPWNGVTRYTVFPKR